MPPKQLHEIRDPVHGFIKLDADERKVLDSLPVQRLRDIRQLGMSHLVYPGATHTRFEHSLGVMELASRVFDIVTAQPNIHPKLHSMISAQPQVRIAYWKRVLRIAALCHDIGHLPFSHAVESRLLPPGSSHESITANLIKSDPLASVLRSLEPSPSPEHVCQVAVGQRHSDELEFTDWILLLHEIIANDALGVDRMDYLLRDSLHTGVAYGKFDLHRLVESIRILPASGDSDSFTLGIEVGGLHAAESLLLARYFIYMQVYHHHVRAAYDLHLGDFLQAWLPNQQFPTDPHQFLNYSDPLVLMAIQNSARNPATPGSSPALRINNREHFRLVYSPTVADRRVNENPVSAVFISCAEKFGRDALRQASFRPQTDPLIQFPIVDRDLSIQPAQALSIALSQIPIVDAEYVFADPSVSTEIANWIKTKKDEILRTEPEEQY